MKNSVLALCLFRGSGMWLCLLMCHGELRRGRHIEERVVDRRSTRALRRSFAFSTEGPRPTISIVAAGACVALSTHVGPSKATSTPLPHSIIETPVLPAEHYSQLRRTDVDNARLTDFASPPRARHRPRAIRLVRPDHRPFQQSIFRTSLPRRMLV